MYKILLYIIIATLLNSLLALVGVFSILIKEKLLRKISFVLIAFSAGTLMGGAFFHLLSEALEKSSSFTVFTYAILGFITFFVIETFFHWHHCDCGKDHPFTYLMIIGDCLHNFLDGLVIASSFLLSVPLGIITTLVIMAHELPQEIGLFGVLIFGKYKKSKAVLSSFFAQTTAVLGGIIGFFMSSSIESLSLAIIPFAAGGFLYISASDLIPEIHKMNSFDSRKALLSLVPFILGILLMIVLRIVFNTI